MSINAMQKVNLPKGLGTRNSFHATNNLANRKDEYSTNPNIIVPKKKHSLVAKTQKLEIRVKSKLGDYQSEPNNENDKNIHNVKVNLNKEIFSKKSIEGKNMTVEEENLNLTKENKISVGDSDYNVSMKSAKDDSAIKEQYVEKTLKEQILGKISNNNISTIDGSISNLTGINAMNLTKKSTVSSKDSSMTNFTLKDEKSPMETTTKVDSNILIKTIKQINIESITPYSSSPANTLNLENLLINKQLAPQWTTEEYRRVCTILVKKDYHNSILKSIFEEEEAIEDCLSRHKITERMRCRMVDWMIEVLTNYKCEDNTFFIAVNIMDKYFKCLEKTRILQPAELHLIGVTSMFIASKYQDIYPLRLKTVHEKIAHKKLSTQEIKTKEEDITKTLNYIIGKASQWEFISNFIEDIFYNVNNNFYITDKTLSETLPEFKKPFSGSASPKNGEKNYSINMINLLKHVAIYLAKMNCHDIQLVNKKPSLLAAGTVFVAMKICEQINKEDYVNDAFTRKLVDISRKSENEIIKCAQKILNNAQNFDTIFNGLENLKRIHFNAIIELTNTK
jgi:hypothetical protein